MNSRTVKIAIEAKRARRGIVTPETILQGISALEVDCSKLSNDELVKIFEEDGLCSNITVSLPEDRQLELLNINIGYYKWLGEISESSFELIIKSDDIMYTDCWWAEAGENLSNSMRRRILDMDIESVLNENIYIIDYLSENRPIIPNTLYHEFSEETSLHISDKDVIYLINKNPEFAHLFRVKTSKSAIKVIGIIGVESKREYARYKDIISREDLLNDVSNNSNNVLENIVNDFTPDEIEFISSIRRGFLSSFFPYEGFFVTREFWSNNLDIVRRSFLIHDIDEDILLQALRNMKSGRDRDCYIEDLIANNCIRFSNKGFEELFKAAFM